MVEQAQDTRSPMSSSPDASGGQAPAAAQHGHGIEYPRLSVLQPADRPSRSSMQSLLDASAITTFSAPTAGAVPGDSLSSLVLPRRPGGADEDRLNWPPEVQEMRSRQERERAAQRSREGQAEAAERHRRFEELFASYSPEQQAEILSAAEDGYAQSMEWKMLQLGLLRSFVEEELKQIDAPTTWGGKLGNLAVQARETLGITDGGETRAIEGYRRRLENFLQEALPAIQEEVLNGSPVWSAVAMHDPGIMDLARSRAGLTYFDLTDPESEGQVLDSYMKLLGRYRELHDYGPIETTAFTLLQQRFEEEIAANLGDDQKRELREEAKRHIAEQISPHHDSWLDPPADARQKGALPMTEQQIAGYTAALEEEEYRRLEARAAAALLDPSKFTPEQRQVWEMYNDVMDPQGEWFNLEDATWDRIKEEVIINAPLIAVSGGAACGARAALTAGARALAGRVALRKAIAEGAEFTARELVEEGGKWIGRSFARSAAMQGAGMLTGGAAFETAYTALHGEWLGNMPDWGQRILWSAATMGLLQKAGELGDRAFRFMQTNAGRIVVDEAGKPVIELTKLGRAIEKIDNQAVRSAAEQLLVKAHLEAAAMLVVGAARERVYRGDIKEFMQSFPDQVAHAYFTVGALKLTHSGLATIGGRQFPRTRPEEGAARPADPLQSRTDTPAERPISDITARPAEARASSSEPVPRPKPLGQSTSSTERQQSFLRAEQTLLAEQAQARSAGRSVEPDFAAKQAEELLHLGKAVLDEAGVKWTANEDGSITISPDSSTAAPGGLNDYACRLKRSRGADLIYDPRRLIERDARSSVGVDAEGRTFYLPHEAIASLRPTTSMYHEKTHLAFLELERSGGQSPFLGEFEAAGEPRTAGPRHYETGMAFHEIAANGETLNRSAQLLAQEALGSAPDPLRLRGIASEAGRAASALELTARTAGSRIRTDILPAVEGDPAKIRIEEREVVNQAGEKTVLVYGSAETSGIRTSVPLITKEQLAELAGTSQEQTALARQLFSKQLSLLADLSDAAALRVERLRAQFGEPEGGWSPDQLRDYAQAAAAACRPLVEHYRVDPALLLGEDARHAVPWTSGEEPSEAASDRQAAAAGSRHYDMPETVEEPAGPGSARSTLNDILESTASVPLTARQPGARALEARITNADGAFTVSAAQGRVRITFDGRERAVEVRAELTTEEFSELHAYMTRNKERFFPGNAYNANAIQEGVAYAKLHAAFYSSGATPREAAEALKTYLSTKLGTGGTLDWPAPRIEVAEGLTYRERNERLARGADALTELSSYAAEGSAGELARMREDARAAVHDNSRRADARLLDGILEQRAETAPLEAVLERTALQRSGQERPSELRIKVEQRGYVHYDGRISIEQTPSGLRVEVLTGQGLRQWEAGSLKELMEKLSLASRVPGGGQTRWDLVREQASGQPLRRSR